MLETSLVHINPSVTFIGHMSVLIEQQACMMAEITQLRAALEHHTAKFTTLCRVFAYV